MTQTPQTGAHAVVVRALYCVPTLKHEEELFECVRTIFLHTKQWILNRPYFQVVSGITPALQNIYIDAARSIAGGAIYGVLMFRLTFHDDKLNARAGELPSVRPHENDSNG